MDKLKEIKFNNQMKWKIFVGSILAILAILAIIHMVNYSKATIANSKMDIPQNEIGEEIIEQSNLVDTSKMSEEELKKLNKEEQKKTQEKNKDDKTTKTMQNKYYIKVNYGAQVVTIYTQDKEGRYTVPVRACVCSTGTATPTSGVYRMSWKATWGKLFGNVWGQYCTQIVGDILFHSVPYKQNRKDTLVSAYYDRLGTKDSMGCIRLTTIDALWIFNNCPSGTQVEFYSSSNPGPLGKPTARKVSGAPGKLKTWDPTDPDSNNPWRTYKPNEDENKEQNTNTNTNTNTNINTDNNTITNTTTPEPEIPNNTTNTEPIKPIEPENPMEPVNNTEGNTNNSIDNITNENTQVSGENSMLMNSI